MARDTHKEENPRGEVTPLTGAHSTSKNTGGNRSAQFRTEADQAQGNGNACLNVAQQYATERDWSVFPANLEGGGKKSYKSIDYSGSNWGHTKDLAEIRRDFKKWPRAGIGVPTGRVNNIIDIEADTPEGHAKLGDVDGRVSLAKLENELGPLPNTAMFESPSGSRHHLFNYPKHADPDVWINPVAGALAKGVDVCADGDMMIAPPSVRADGTYRWINGLPVADLPDEWLERIVEVSSGAGGERHGNGKTAYGEFSKQRELAPLDKIERALAALPTDSEIGGGREFYVKIGHAVKSGTDGSIEGLRLFARWRQGAPDYDEQKVIEKWRGFHPTNTTVGTLFHFAELADPNWDQKKPATVDNAAEEKPIEPLGVSEIFPIDEATIPRRKWLLPGLLMRGHVTEVVAPPGSGKSLLSDQMSIMMGLKMDWAGWSPREQCRTLIINAEDDHDEQKRRLAAAAVTMGANQNALKGYVLLADEPHNIIVAEFDAKTKTMTATPFLEQIIKTITEKNIDIVWVDPFAETFAGDENSNNDLKWAAVLWREVARRTGAAVVLVHHTKKYASGAMAGDADASRGAGALIGIVRVIVTIFTMTKDEADLMEIPEEKRHRYIRFDDAKANYSLLTGIARWFYKETYTLKNASKFISGDDVGVLVPWEAPGLFADVTSEMINAFYDKVNAGVLDEQGKPTGEHYTLHKTSENLARWLGTIIQEELHCDEARAKKILKHWKEKKVLVEFAYRDPIQRRERKGVRIEAQAEKG